MRPPANLPDKVRSYVQAEAGTTCIEGTSRFREVLKGPIVFCNYHQCWNRHRDADIQQGLQLETAALLHLKHHCPDGTGVCISHLHAESTRRNLVDDFYVFSAIFTTERPAGRVGKIVTIKSLKIPLHERFIIDDSCEVIEEAIAAGITCAHVKLQRKPKPSVGGDNHHIVGWFADALPIVGRWARKLNKD